jgi:prepilin-type N-terminal cleavage/methylation domain-containing protein
MIRSSRDLGNAVTTPRFGTHSQSSGFTLIEMMVSMTVLVLLVLMATKILNGTTLAATNGRKRLDADSQARMIFDRMGGDFGRMVLRKDLDCLFKKVTGNDSLFFYSEAPAFFSGSNQCSISLVGYRINLNQDPSDPNKTIPQLERLGKGLNWDGNGGAAPSAYPVFLSFTGTDAGPDSASTLFSGPWSNLMSATGSDPDFQVIGEQVFRLEIAFLLSDGTVSNQPIKDPSGSKNNLTATRAPSSLDNSNFGYSGGSRWYDTLHYQGYVCTTASSSGAVWTRLGLKDVSGIVVALGILDSSSQQIVADKSKLGGGFRDPTDLELKAAPPKLMAKTWLDAVYNGSETATDGSPKIAASQIRVYQRTFFLNQFYQ